MQEVGLAAAGTLITFNATSASDTFTNDGRVIVLAKNGASAAVITVVATQTVTGASLSVPNLAVAVGASTTRAIGPFPKATFNDGSSEITMAYANSATLTFALVGY